MDSTASSAEAYNLNRDGAASGLFMSPKQIGRDDAERAEIISFAIKLMGQGVSASEVASERIPAAYPGVSVSISTVASWARGVKVKLREGRPVGTPGSRKKTSPHRDRILQLLDAGHSQSEIARQLGLSRQLVHALIAKSRA